jgi:predicted nucleotide-binding protein
LEALLTQLEEADMGLFVFSPDDTVKIRNAEQGAVRDNVIFELGLYVGRLGITHSFIVARLGGEILDYLRTF